MNLEKFMEYAGRLKRIKRTGWMIRGVPEPETVAEHTYRAALLGYILAKIQGANAERVMIMLLIHDLAESIIGDIIPEAEQYLNKEEAEKSAMEQILTNLDEDISKELMGIYLEFMEGTTLEARIARKADKMEMSFQAREYARMGFRIDEEMQSYL